MAHTRSILILDDGFDVTESLKMILKPFSCKLLHIIFLTAFLYLCLPLSDIHSAQVTLAWDANTSSGIAGYKVYYGTSSGSYPSVIDVGNNTTYTVLNLQNGTTHYFAVTDYDTSGKESGYSNQVSYSVPAGCTYSISPTSQSMGSSGGTGAVSVTAASGCSWNAASNASWIIVTSNSKGTGNGTVNYSVSANSSSTSQTGTMTIAGQTFTVKQSACSYTISPTSQSFNSSGGTGSIKVSCQTDCSWTASSNVSWITITSASGGNGNGKATFSVSSNSTTSSRTGTLIVAGRTFKVTQSGARYR